MNEETSKEGLKNSIMVTKFSQFERKRRRLTKAYQIPIRRARTEQSEVRFPFPGKKKWTLAQRARVWQPNCENCSHEGVFQTFPKP